MLDPDPVPVDELLGLTELAAAFTDLAAASERHSRADFGGAAQLARRAVSGAEVTDLARFESGSWTLLAHTGRDAEVLDDLRARTGQAPAVTAAATDAVVTVDVLADDPRWPAFGPLATAHTGLLSALSVPVTVSRDCVLTLSWYSSWPFGFTKLDRICAQLAAAYLHTALTTTDRPVCDRAPSGRRPIA